MIVCGIDPGTLVSGIAVWDGERVLDSGVLPNDQLLENLPTHLQHCAIELPKAYVMKTQGGHAYVPDHLTQTCYVIGRIQQRWFEKRGELPAMVPRSDVLRLLSANRRRKGSGTQDSQVRVALIALVGDKGTKANPGPTYGVKSHAWQALGVAFTHYRNLPPEADF